MISSDSSICKGPLRVGDIHHIQCSFCLFWDERLQEDGDDSESFSTDEKAVLGYNQFFFAFVFAVDIKSIPQSSMLKELVGLNTVSVQSAFTGWRTYLSNHV